MITGYKATGFILTLAILATLAVPAAADRHFYQIQDQDGNAIVQDPAAAPFPEAFLGLVAIGHKKFAAKRI